MRPSLPPAHTLALSSASARPLQTASAACASLARRRRDPERFGGAATASNSISASEEFPSGRATPHAEVLSEQPGEVYKPRPSRPEAPAAAQHAWDEPDAEPELDGYGEDDASWADPGQGADYYGSGADIGFDGPVGRSLRRLSPAARYGIDMYGVRPMMPWGMVEGIRHLRRQVNNGEMRNELKIWKRHHAVQMTNHQFSAPRDDLYVERNRNAAALVAYYTHEAPARYVAIHGALSTLKKRLAAEAEEAEDASPDLPDALRPKPFRPARLVEWDCAGAEGAWAFADVFDPPPKPEWASYEWAEGATSQPPGTAVWPNHLQRHPTVRPVEQALEYWGATGDIKRMNVAADMLARTSSWESMRAWRGKVSRFDTWGRSHSPPIHTHMYDRLIATLTFRPAKPSKIVVPKRLYREVRRAEREAGHLDPTNKSDQQHLRDTAAVAARHVREAADAAKNAAGDEADNEGEAVELDHDQLTPEESEALAQEETKRAKQRRKQWATADDDVALDAEDQAAYERYLRSDTADTLPQTPTSYPNHEAMSQANKAAMEGELEGSHEAPKKDTVLLSAFRLSHLESDQERVDYVTRMWKQKWADVFILVDHADPRGFASIASARALLLRLGATTHAPRRQRTQKARQGGEEVTIDGETFIEDDTNVTSSAGTEEKSDEPQAVGAHVVAPCPHDKPCPLLHPFSLIPEVDRTNLNADLQNTRAICGFKHAVGMPREHAQLFNLKKKDEYSKDYTYCIVRRGPRPSLDAAQEALRQEAAAEAERVALRRAVARVPDLHAAAEKTKVGEVEWVRRQMERDRAAALGEEEQGATHILTAEQLQQAVGRIEKDEQEAAEARQVLDSLIPSVVQHLRQTNPEAYGELSDDDAIEIVRQMQSETQGQPAQHTFSEEGEAEAESSQSPLTPMTPEQKAEVGRAEAQYYRDMWPDEAAFLDEEFPDQPEAQHGQEQQVYDADTAPKQPTDSEHDRSAVQVDMPPPLPGREAVPPPPDLGPTEYAAMAIESYSWPRLLITASKKGGHVLIYGCTSDGNIKRYSIRKRDVQRFQDARKSRRGDLFPHLPEDSRATIVERARADVTQLATPAAMRERTKTQAKHMKRQTPPPDDYDIDRDTSGGTDTMGSDLDDAQIEKVLELERLTDYAAGLDVADETDSLRVYDPYAPTRQTSSGSFKPRREKTATLKQRTGLDPDVAAYGAIGPDAMAIVNKERLAPPSALVTPVHGDDSFLPSISAGLTLRARKARELKRKQSQQLVAQIDPAYAMEDLEVAAMLHKSRATETQSGQPARDDIPDATDDLPRDKHGKPLRTHHKVHLDFQDDDPESGFRALERHRRRATRPRSMGDYDFGLDQDVIHISRKRK